MSLLIRSIEPEDEPLLWEYLYLALYVPTGHSPFPRDIVQHPDVRKYVQSWGQADDIGFICELDAKPVGAVWLRLLVGSNKGYGYWDECTPELSMAVISNYRSQGIGSKMLERLIDNAALRYSAICLSVDQNNPAKRLYDRFGFQVVMKKGSSLTMVRHFAILK